MIDRPATATRYREAFAFVNEGSFQADAVDMIDSHSNSRYFH
ncbi:MAG: hypothetical protein ABSE58_04480 [Candidatus Limnocylindrales bacterium]